MSLSVKQKLRSVLQKKRSTLSSHYRQQAHISAVNFLLSNKQWQLANNVGLYSATPLEFATDMFFQAAYEARKFIYLPVINSANKQLKFVRYKNNEALVINKYNILEPQNQAEIDLAQIDLLLLPVVGYDQKGYRLGMGGGYYDRSLQHLPNKPFKLGLAYKLQYYPDLPSDPHDIKLDAILTEEGIHYF